MKIIDASVAVKWFVDEPIGKNLAVKVLKEIEADPSSFAVPELFFAEMLNVLCRLSKNSLVINSCMTRLEHLGLSRIGLGHEVLETAATLALDWNVSGYDAIYVACAKLTSGQWLTFDQEAAKKVKTKGLVLSLRQKL